jgi:uncharacterized protein (TIGR02391 family)
MPTAREDLDFVNLFAAEAREYIRAFLDHPAILSRDYSALRTELAKKSPRANNISAKLLYKMPFPRVLFDIPNHGEIHDNYQAAVDVLDELIGACEDYVKGQGQTQPPIEPTSSVHHFHSAIEGSCRTLVNSQHYDAAILNAFKMVEQTVRQKIAASNDEVGVNLMSKALNPKAPKLVFSDVPAEQEAAHSLFRGAIGLLKNPQSHRFVGINDPQETMEALAFASLLMRLLDRAKVNA